jgi:hypothetical protein
MLIPNEEPPPANYKKQVIYICVGTIEHKITLNYILTALFLTERNLFQTALYDKL